MLCLTVVAALATAGLGTRPAAAGATALGGITLESSAPNAVYGQSVTFTATLTGPSGPPTGTVDFLFDDSIALCSSVALVPLEDSAATATCTIPAAGSFGIGIRAVTAMYPGDATYDVAVSDPLDQVVGKADSSLALGTSGSPAVWGDAVTFTATVAAVAPGAGIPAGTVAFRSDGVTIAGCGARPLVAGSTTCTTAALGLGSHSITAEYGGSGNFDGVSGALAGGQTVGGAATTTALAAPPAVPVAGEPVTFTATVQSAAGTPAGAVAFTADGEPITGCESRALVDGVATCVHAFGAGTHTIGAAFTGSADFAASDAEPITQIVDPAGTTVALGAAPSSSVVGQEVTLTATVAVVAPGTAGLDGTVEFRSGGAAIEGCAAVPLVPTAVCITAALPRGAHALTARYSGGADTAASTSTVVAHDVTRAPTAVSLAVTPGPTDPGASVSLVAQVSVLPPGAAPFGGTVTFRAGGTVIGTRPVGPTGGATLTTSSLAPGLHDLRAELDATDDLAAATSPTVAHRVRYPTTVTVSSSSSPSLPGRAVQLHAVVGSAVGAPDGGTVQFRIDGDLLGDPVPVDDDGGATSIPVVPSEPGSNVTATYAGTDLFAAGGPGHFRQQVAPGRTTTVVVGAPSPSPFGAAVTLTATVTSDSGTPDGEVVFRRGATIVGTAALDASGKAVVVVPGSVLGAVGDKSISAAYSGSPSFRASTGIRLHRVDTARTSVTLRASANPSARRAAVAFIAKVAVVAPGAGRPTGTVTFRRGATVIGQVRLDATGRARLVVPAGGLGAPGAKSIQAAYGGSAAFAPASVAVLHHVSA